jgi:tetratricopeptide (TPR) repeat protein
MEIFFLLFAFMVIAVGAIAMAARADRTGRIRAMFAQARIQISRPGSGVRSPGSRVGSDGEIRDPEELASLESFERQITSAERRGDSEEAARLGRQSESMEEAWRAQRALRGRAPKRLPQYSLGEGLSSRDTRELREMLDRSRTLTTLSPDDWSIRGNGYMAVDDIAHAAEAYRRALQEQPDNVDTMFYFAVALSQGDRQREALATFDRVLEFRPDDPEALTGRANALADVGQRKDALESYRQALEADPGHVDALYNRANVLADDGQLDAAIRAYDETLAVRSDLPDVHNDKGNTLSLMGQHEEALASYDRAISLRPSYARAFYNRGVTLARLSQMEDAVEAFERCLRLRLDIPEAHYGKGVALARLGRNEEAVMAFDRSLALRPSFPDAMLQKARSHSRLGQEREAMDWLTQAIVGSESIRAHARDERDFDTLRTSPSQGRAFEELVAG